MRRPPATRLTPKTAAHWPASSQPLFQSGAYKTQSEAQFDWGCDEPGGKSATANPNHDEPDATNKTQKYQRTNPTIPAGTAALRPRYEPETSAASSDSTRAPHLRRYRTDTHSKMRRVHTSQELPAALAPEEPAR